MKRRHIAFTIVLYCGYVVPQNSQAVDCNAFRSDIQSIQVQMRGVDMNRANSGFDAVTSVSRIVKNSCMDPISALDMSSFGFTPGASALVTKLAGQACQRLIQEMSQKVNDVNSRISQGINDAQGRVLSDISGTTGSTIGGTGSFGPDTTMGPGGTTSSPISTVTNAVSHAWDRMKNWMTP